MKERLPIWLIIFPLNPILQTYTFHNFTLYFSSCICTPFNKLEFNSDVQISASFINTANVLRETRFYYPDKPKTGVVVDNIFKNSELQIFSPREKLF